MYGYTGSDTDYVLLQVTIKNVSEHASWGQNLSIVLLCMRC